MSFWAGAVAGGVVLGAWLLRETVLSRAIAGLVSAVAGYTAAVSVAARFLHGVPFSAGWLVAVLGAGPVGALLGLALAIKLTEAQDGSRAFVTAASAGALLLLLR